MYKSDYHSNNIQSLESFFYLLFRINTGLKTLTKLMFFFNVSKQQ